MLWNYRPVFKYRVTASEIPETFASELRDLLISKPDEDAYDKLRDAIITRLAESRTQRVRRLLSAEVLENRKPSQFLRHVQHLLGDELGSNEQDFLRELFLQRIPDSTRFIFSASGASVRLADVADMADRMLECSFSPVHVVANRHESAGDTAFSSDTHTNINFLLDSFRRLEERVSSLAEEFDQLQVSSFAGMTVQADRPSRPSDRLSTCRYSRRSLSRPRTINNGLCYYHERFGDKAHTCYAGCRHFCPKRTTKLLEAASQVGTQTSRLKEISDATTKLTILVDTGADLSFLPPRSCDPELKVLRHLQSANGSRISIFSTRFLTADLGLRRE